MKAWITFEGEPIDGCLLVYAETRNKARWIAARSIWGDDWEYPYIGARRNKQYDHYYDGRSSIEANDELPDGAPDFYADIEGW